MRYADDAICHCKSAEEARALWSALADRFAACNVLEIGLEDGLQYDLGSGQNHPVSNGWDAERPLVPIRLWDHHLPHRIGPVRLRDQVLALARQPSLQALFLDFGESHPIRTWRSGVGASEAISVERCEQPAFMNKGASQHSHSAPVGLDAVLCEPHMHQLQQRALPLQFFGAEKCCAAALCET